MMNATPELFPQENITPEEWAWVQDLIQEVQREEKRESFVKSLFEWDLAVRQFRKVEMRRIILASPTENDILHHALCLHALLAIGNALLLEGRKFSDEDLVTFKVSMPQIVAYVAELEQSFREWHHRISEVELSKTRQAIFSVAS